MWALSRSRATGGDSCAHTRLVNRLITGGLPYGCADLGDLGSRHPPRPGDRGQRAGPRDEVIATLLAAGDRRGARIVAARPHRAGVLDALTVDRLLVRTHTESQRLTEELRIA